VPDVVVVDAAPLPPAVHEAGFLQSGEILRDRRLRDVEARREILQRSRSGILPGNDCDPPGIHRDGGRIGSTGACPVS
jgi:hypothetical protein